MVVILLFLQSYFHMITFPHKIGLDKLLAVEYHHPRKTYELGIGI